MKRWVKRSGICLLVASSIVGSFIGGWKFHEYTEYNRIVDRLSKVSNNINEDDVIFTSYSPRKLNIAQNRFKEKHEFKFKEADIKNWRGVIYDDEGEYKIEFNKETYVISIEMIN